MARVLLLLWIALVSCTPQVRASFDIAQRVTGKIGNAPAARVEDSLTSAQRFAVESGIEDMRRAVTGLFAAGERPEATGSVLVVIEPSRLADQVGSGASRARLVQLQPGLQNNRLIYTLRVDQSRYVAEGFTPQELSLYLYAAALRRETYESHRSPTMRGTALLDTLMARPTDGSASIMVRAHDDAWLAVVDRAYRPLRAQNRVPELQNLETLAARATACRGDAACWQAAVRTFLGL